MGFWVWFNLVLFSNGRWLYVDAYETLEACQEARQEIEQEEPGNYYCFPANVKKVQDEKSNAKEVS